MEPPTFRGKPSDSHVIWRRSGAGADASKRFDEKHLRRWCSARGVDFETDKRVDHDRSDQPREQYRCVFAWSDAESESFDMGDDEWEIATQETPETFVEIDDAGEVRFKSWDDEFVLDVEELWLDGDAFVFRAAEFDGAKRLDARKLKTRPE
ncbi:hypothetical protein [Halosimplex salinum]|uniref:hypothetical protein n=1 Tax=Halosimplex salinum TaxID=1710538 RepID=UPI000F491DA7|nr:hypothetical protein [Halosimplex salinum]